MDENTFMDFVHKAVGDVGALFAGSMVVLGDRLGLYRAMADGRPTGSSALAERTGTTERYVREWLAAQAAAGYLEYLGGDLDGQDRGAAQYRLPAERAAVLTDETNPFCVIGAFQTALAAVHSTDRLTTAFRTGEGVGWADHDPDLYPGCERLFGPSYRNFLATTWIPSLVGMDERLRAGARVADVGCGHGASTLVMAQAYPSSSFLGVDAHQTSVESARKRAAEAGVSERVKFEVGTALTFGGSYDLVAFFDCLHDMGDPAGACAHVREVLNPGGALMIVEPHAGDRVEDNLNPVGALYYAASTLLCTPSAVSQGGDALGAQAGEERMRAVVTGAGFSSFRRVAETPFNQVYEARV